MDQSFKVKVNKTIDFNISETESSNLDSIKTASNSYHILHEHVSYNAKITDSNYHTKSYQVTVNNNSYDVTIYNDLDARIQHMGFEVGSSKMVNEIKAPMPGLILDINIEVGQEVEENDTLLILEAMKMENIITAPRAGKIKAISVQKGGTVDKNDLLIEFDA